MSTVAAFYAAHPITLYVGSNADGAYGVYAYALSRHLGRHIPGNPPISVKFKGEKAGFVLTNELATALPRDGTVIAAIRGANTVESLLNPSKDVKFDTRQLNWLGSVSRQNGTIVTWHTSDIRTIDDARKRDVLVGAEAPESNIGTLPNILNGLLGTRFRTVYNFSRAGLKQAMEKGEVEAICGLGYNTLLAAHSDWLEGKKLNFLAHTGLEPDPLIPGVPCTIQFARTEDDRNVIRLMDYRQAMGRPYAAPPGMPADRLAALQQAFRATMTDPAFLADAKEHHMLVDPLSPEKMAAMVADAYSMSPRVVRRTWDLLNGAGA